MSNPTAERALGTPAEEMQRDTLRESFPSTIGSDVPAVLRDVVLSGRKGRELGELRSDDKPFSERFFRLRAFPLRNDHIGVMFEDITERRSAEEVVRRQAQLLDLAHDAIIVRDPNSRVISSVTELSGSTAGPRRKRWEDYDTLLKTQFPISLEEVQNSLFLKGWWEGELVHTTRDGRQIVVASRQVANGTSPARFHSP